MEINEPMDAFVRLLSHVRQTTERSGEIYGELAKFAETPEIKETLEARAFAKTSELAKVDEAFRLIAKTPVKLSGEIKDTFLEDFRREVAEFKGPVVKKVFVLAKAIRRRSQMRWHGPQTEWVSVDDHRGRTIRFPGCEGGLAGGCLRAEHDGAHSVTRSRHVEP